MSEIEKIQKYTERTRIPDDKYGLRTNEWIALARMESVLDAISLAFDYGRAKGYRAAKAG